LRDAAAELTPEAFNGFQASSSESGIATAVPTNEASSSRLELEVLSLAQAEKIVSGAHPDSDAAVNAGTLSFTFGAVENGVFIPGGADTREVRIAPGSTLADVRN